MFRTSNIQKISQSIGGYIKFNTTNCGERVKYNIPVVHAFISLRRGKPFHFFVFTPCVQVVNPWSTLSVFLSCVFNRFCCHLLMLVATHLPSVPLCFELLPSSPSLSFVQRAAAFLLSNAFIDSHLLKNSLFNFHLPHNTPQTTMTKDKDEDDKKREGQIEKRTTEG